MKTTFLLQACVAAMAAALSGCGDDTSSSGTTTTETTTGTGGTGGGVTTGGGGSGGATGGGGSSAGGGGGGGSAPCALGSTWTTVDDFQHSPGEPSNPVGIAALPPNRLFAVGIAKKGSFEWVVRRSDDGGSTWATIDAMAGGANGVTVDAAGRVYVVGGIGPNRVVRRSTDGGDSWENVESAPIGNGTCNTGFVTATSDAVYAGWSCDTDGWTVRRSDDGGQTWTTADSYLYMAGTPSRLAGLGDGADGNALSGGYGTEPGGITHWIVRRGAAQGTWAIDDDYQLAAGAAASVLGFGGATRPIAVGRANDAAAVSHWIVRRFEGGTWSTLDDVAALDAAGTRAPAGAHEDGTGATYVVGAVADGAAPTAVLTRRSADGTSWSDVDTFSYAAGFPSSPVSTMAHDGPGNLYAMVRGVAADGSAHWLVRKLACQ